MKLEGELDLGSIVQVEFPEDQYFKLPQEKKIIVLHHTAGWDNARGVFEYWKSNREHVGTCMSMEDDGKLYQGYSSKYWAWHINTASRGNKLPDHLAHYKEYAHAESLERASIGLEICNWGPLTLKDDGFYHTYLSTSEKPITVPESRVVRLDAPFRGYEYYERYTDQEVEQTWRLVRYWCARYGIPTAYHPDMWDIYGVALAGQPGVFTHASFRTDKFDLSPQKHLIDMLKAL